MIATREHIISRRDDLSKFLKIHPLHHLYGGENAFLLQDYLSAIGSAGIALTKVLNPLESDINLYPETVQSTKAMFARKFGLPFSSMIPDIFLTWRGRLSKNPGRLYTFVGTRQD